MKKEKVIFDPRLMQHRADFASYLEFDSWKNALVSYEIKDMSANKVAVMQRQLVEYYTQKEFSVV